MADSIMQPGRKECYITGSTTQLCKHHIYAAGRRKAADEWGCWIWLRWDWHTGADYSVHKNSDLDLRLKQECQRKFEQLHGHEQFMNVFGKSWI